ncbi:MAG: hypothetical protein U0Q47_06695 [Mycobacterium sp.]
MDLSSDSATPIGVAAGLRTDNCPQRAFRCAEVPTSTSIARRCRPIRSRRRWHNAFHPPKAMTLGLINEAISRPRRAHHQGTGDAPAHHAGPPSTCCCSAHSRRTPACCSTGAAAADKELVILRVGHLRGSEYELQQHRRLARRMRTRCGVAGQIFAGRPPKG